MVEFANNAGFPYFNERGEQLRRTSFQDTPPPAPFLREILQNSDDAGAKELVIAFTPEALFVSNNGRAFNSNFTRVKEVPGTGGGVKWEGGDILRMQQISGNQSKEDPEQGDENPPVGRYNTGFQLFHRFSNEVRYHYVQMKSEHGKIDIDNWTELEGLNARFKSIQTHFEERTGGLLWRKLPSGEEKLPLFYNEADDERTRRETGGVLFEFPWRKELLANSENQELADFVKLSAFAPRFEVMNDNRIEDFFRIAVAMSPLLVLHLRRLETIQLAFFSDKLCSVSTISLSRGEGRLAVRVEEQSALSPRAATSASDRWNAFREVFENRASLRGKEMDHLEFIDLREKVRHYGVSSDLSEHKIKDHRGIVIKHVFKPYSKSLEQVCPKNAGETCNHRVVKKGSIRALVPLFDLERWFNRLNDTLQNLGEKKNPNFRGFPLYSMLPLSEPGRFNSLGPAYDGDFFPTETRHELVPKDGGDEIERTWNEHVLTAMMKFNLEFQAELGDLSFLPESLPLNPDVFTFNLGGVHEKSPEFSTELPCWTSPYMQNMRGEPCAPADLIVPRNQDLSYDENTAAVCDVLGLSVAPKQIVAELDSKKRKLHPDFLEGLRRNNPNFDQLFDNQLKDKLKTALNNANPSLVADLTIEQKESLAKLTQTYCSDSDLPFFPDTNGELRRISQFVRLPEGLKVASSLFDDFPTPHPSLNLKIPEAERRVLIQQVDAKFGDVENLEQHEAGAHLELLQQFAAWVGKEDVSKDRPDLLRYRFIPARFRGVVRLHRLPHRSVHICINSDQERRYPPVLSGGGGAQGRGVGQCPHCKVDLERAPYTGSGVAELQGGARVAVKLEHYDLSKNAIRGHPNLVSYRESDDDNAGHPHNWLGQQLPMLELGVSGDKKVAGNLGAWMLKSASAHLKATLVNPRPDTDRLGHNESLLDWACLANFLGVNEEGLSIEQRMQALEYCSAVSADYWTDTEKKKLTLPDTSGAYHPASQFYLSIDEELGSFLTSVSEGLVFRTLHPEVLEYTPAWNDLSGDLPNLTEVLTKSTVQPSIGVETLTQAVEALLNDNDFEGADRNLAKIFMIVAGSELRDQIQGSALQSHEWVPVRHTPQGSDRRRPSEVPLISEEFQEYWGKNREHPILKRDGKPMKWLGCFENEEIDQLNTLSKQLQGAGIGTTGYPRATCLAPIFSQPNFPGDAGKIPLEFFVREMGERFKPTHILFRNAWRPLEEIREMTWTKHAFVAKLLEHCPDRKGALNFTELEEGDQFILTEFASQSKYEPRSFVANDEGEAENNWIDLNIILGSEEGEWHHHLRDNITRAATTGNGLVFWNEKGPTEPLCFLEGTNLPEALQRVFEEDHGALAYASHLATFLGLDGDKNQAWDEAIAGATFPDFTALKKARNPKLKTCVSGLLRRLHSVDLKDFSNASEWNEYRHRLIDYSVEAPPFALLSKDGYALRDSADEAWYFEEDQEGDVLAVLSRLNPTEDYAFVPVESTKKADRRPFKVEKRATGTNDAIERHEFHHFLKDLKRLAETLQLPIRSESGEDFRGFETEGLPTENRIFTGKHGKEFYLGAVNITEKYLLQGSNVFWLEREASLDDLKEIIFKIFDLDADKQKEWRRILNDISSENAAIRPSRDWLIELGIEASEWEGVDLHLSRPFFLSQKRSESAELIRKANQCMICGQQTPINPNDRSSFKETTKAIFGEKACAYLVNTANGPTLDRATLDSQGNFLYVCPNHHHLMKNRCVKIKLDVNGTPKDIREAHRELSGHTEKQIRDLLEKKKSLSFHVWERFYGKELDFHERGTAEDIMQLVGDEQLASFREVVVAYIQAMKGLRR